jgi:glyoxylase-like metal-dependent hydrolase (beta-lactamase superfamily II)
VSEHAPREVSPGVWLIRLPLPFPVATLNVYLARRDCRYLLVDCGLKTKACREALAGALAALGVEWAEIRQVLLTHIHPDHFGLAGEIQRLSGAEILLHRAEAAWMRRWQEEGFLERHAAWLEEHGVAPEESGEISAAFVGVAEFIEVVETYRTIEDGERLPVEGGEMEVLWTPGHSPGLLTLYWPQRRLYFSSDHIIERITPNIGVHSGSPENPLGDYLASLERVRRLEIDCILPSHGPPFGGHRAWIDATVEHHRLRCERMLAAVAERARTAYEVARVEWGAHLSPLAERFAVAEALAHLEYLRREGRVEPRREGGVVRWSKTV